MKRYLLGTVTAFLLIVFSCPMTAQSLNSTMPNLKIKKANATGAEQTFTVQDAVQLVRFFMSQEGIERCESDLYNRKLKLVARPGVDLHALLQRNTLRDKVTAMGYTMELPPASLLSNNTEIPQKSHATSAIASPTASSGSASAQTKGSIDKKALLEKAKAIAAAKAAKVGKSDSRATSSNGSAKPDCADCGEVKVNNKLKESIVKNADYGGNELLIDMPMGNFDSGNTQATAPKSAVASEKAGEPEELIPPPAIGTPQMDAAQLDSLRQILFKKHPK